MNDFRERLIIEAKELQEKIDKLHNFVERKEFRSLAEKQQYLLNDQLFIMVQYYDILETRLTST